MERDYGCPDLFDDPVCSLLGLERRMMLQALSYQIDLPKSRVPSLPLLRIFGHFLFYKDNFEYDSPVREWTIDCDTRGECRFRFLEQSSTTSGWVLSMHALHNPLIFLRFDPPLVKLGLFCALPTSDAGGSAIPLQKLPVLESFSSDDGSNYVESYSQAALPEKGCGPCSTGQVKET